MKNKRFIVLVSNRGDLTCVNPGSFYHHVYLVRKWQELIKVNRPMSVNLAQYVKEWAVRNYNI